MGVDHILNAVGDDVTRRERIEHAVVTHRDAVIDSNGVELGSVASALLDLALDILSHLVEVSMARHELGEAVHDGDDGLAHHLAFHTIGHPQRAGACHASSLGGGGATELDLVI